MTKYFDIEADVEDYDVEAEEPYLTKDLGGAYVILQNEVLTTATTIGKAKPILLYASEIVIDDNPSEEMIFKMKLKGQFRPSTFVAHRHSKGS